MPSKEELLRRRWPSFGTAYRKVHEHVRQQLSKGEHPHKIDLAYLMRWRPDSDEVDLYIAEMLDGTTNRRGNSARAYTSTHRDRAIWIRVQRLREKGCTLVDACAEVAKRWGSQHNLSTEGVKGVHKRVLRRRREDRKRRANSVRDWAGK